MNSTQFLTAWNASGSKVAKPEVSNREMFLASKVFRMPTGNGTRFRFEPSEDVTGSAFLFAQSYMNQREFLLYCTVDKIKDTSFQVRFLLLGQKLITETFYFNQLVFEEGGPLQ